MACKYIPGTLYTHLFFGPILGFCYYTSPPSKIAQKAPPLTFQAATSMSDSLRLEESLSETLHAIIDDICCCNTAALRQEMNENNNRVFDYIPVTRQHGVPFCFLNEPTGHQLPYHPGEKRTHTLKRIIQSLFSSKTRGRGGAPNEDGDLFGNTPNKDGGLFGKTPNESGGLFGKTFVEHLKQKTKKCRSASSLSPSSSSKKKTKSNR